MKKKNKINPNILAHIKFVIKGNGSSLWGKSDEEYIVDNIVLNYENDELDPDFCEIQMFGKNTKWFQYTDEAIIKKINSPQILNYCKSLLPKFAQNKKWKLGWSEQGMQPRNGWSFDFYVDTKRK